MGTLGWKYVIDDKHVAKMQYKNLGKKVEELSEWNKFGVPIPEWFAVSEEVFFDSLTVEQKLFLEEENWCDFMGSMQWFRIAGEAKKEIELAMQCILAENFSVTVPSINLEQALKEQVTYEWLTKKQVLECINQCYITAITMWEKNHFTGKINIPILCVQKMVNAEYSGTAYAVNLENADVKTSVIRAAYGLEGLLSKETLEWDYYAVENANNIVQKKIAMKDRFEILENKKIVHKRLESKWKGSQVLTDEQILQTVRMVRRISQINGCYQKMVWAYEGGRLYLIKSEYMPDLKDVLPEKEIYNVFDNKNIGETYNGLVLPMTFSYVQNTYERVYLQFCKMCGVGKDIIADNERTFQSMLGYYQGHIYYNLRSCYKLINFLPGYRIHRVYLKKLMDMGEGEIIGLKEEKSENVKQSKLKEGLRFLKCFITLSFQYIGIDRTIRSFRSMVSETLDGGEIKKGGIKPKLDFFTMDELYHYLNEVRGLSNKGWNAPIINDFAGMVTQHVFEWMCEKWIGTAEIFIGLLCGQNLIMDAEVLKEIGTISRLISEDEKTVQLFREGDIGEIESKIREKTKINYYVSDFLEKFGDCCLDEVKLESESLRQNPLMLYRIIGETAFYKSYERKNFAKPDAQEEWMHSLEILKKRPIRKYLFASCYKTTMRLISNKEILKYERTRVAGRVRDIINEIGIRLASIQVIEKKEDIFYLDFENLLAYLEGTATSKRLKELIAMRKEEFSGYQNLEEKEQVCFYGNKVIKEEKKAKSKTRADCLTLKGKPCSLGVAEGRARKIEKGEPKILKEGEILVVDYSDPGLVLFLHQARGIVMERGNVSSYLSIVAREAGIPCVTGVSKVSQKIKTGDKIRVNGTFGTVEILETAVCSSL